MFIAKYIAVAFQYRNISGGNLYKEVRLCPHLLNAHGMPLYGKYYISMLSCSCKNKYEW